MRNVDAEDVEEQWFLCSGVSQARYRIEEHAYRRGGIWVLGNFEETEKQIAPVRITEELGR